MNRRTFAALPALSVLAPALAPLAAPPAWAEPPAAIAMRHPGRLTLPEALAIAKVHSPVLHQAQAQTRAARARADQTRAPLFPQLATTNTYDRTTSNFINRPGFVPSTAMIMPTSPSFNTFNFYNLGVNLSYVLWDFGQQRNAWCAATSTASATYQDQRSTAVDVAFNVRSAYVQAWAARALVRVSREALANQQRHLEQTTAFVKAGTHPEIDQITQQSAVASSQVDLINAQNNYATARVNLDQAMGLVRPPGAPAYDVSDTVPPVPGEDGSVAQLMRRALVARPELLAADQRILAARAGRRWALAQYGPTVSAQASFTDAGPSLGNLTWNFDAGVTVTWPLFQGGLVPARVREGSANIDLARAQRSQVILTIRQDVDSAHLSLRAAKAARAAALVGQTSALERLRQAEGRYTAGVGNVIELDDAQLALTRAEVQVVQADFQLGLARAQLLRALGLTTPWSEH